MMISVQFDTKMNSRKINTNDKLIQRNEYAKKALVYIDQQR